MKKLHLGVDLALWIGHPIGRLFAIEASESQEAEPVGLSWHGIQVEKLCLIL